MEKERGDEMTEVQQFEGEESEKRCERRTEGVCERHRDHMVPSGPHDPSRLSYLTHAN